MFAVEIPRRYFYARFSRAGKVDERARCQGVEAACPQERIRAALAGMPPATAAEVAEAAGLDPVSAAACLDEMAGRCRVMFNPLTKRYSLPKAPRSLGLAA